MSAVDDYLDTLGEEQRAELERIRQAVKRLLPRAEEVISYQMPGFKYLGKYLLGYAAFTDHLSLFPTAQPIAELGDKLARFAVSKGTLQFTLDHPIPMKLLEEIIESRASSIARQRLPEELREYWDPIRSKMVLYHLVPKAKLAAVERQGLKPTASTDEFAPNVKAVFLSFPNDPALGQTGTSVVKLHVKTQNQLYRLEVPGRRCLVMSLDAIAANEIISSEDI